MRTTLLATPCYTRGVKSPLWVPALTLSVPLGLLIAIATRALRGPPTSTPSLVYPWSEPVMDWSWWSNVSALAGIGSFLVTLLGFLVGLYALRVARRSLGVASHQLTVQLEAIQAEQARIADELHQRPDLTIRLGVRDHEQHLRVFVGAVHGSPYAWPVPIVIENVGTRSARNLHVSMKAVDGAYLDPLHPGARIARDGEVNWPMIGVLHPTRREESTVRYVIPEPLLGHDCELSITATFDDFPPVSTVLTIGIGTPEMIRDGAWPRACIGA